MNPIKQWILIAESQGFIKATLKGEVIPDLYRKNGTYYSAAQLPRYTLDETAMCEVERSFAESTSRVVEYLDHLYRVVCKTNGSFRDANWKVSAVFLMVTAEAHERAEAYLRMIGKWEEKDK